MLFICHILHDKLQLHAARVAVQAAETYMHPRTHCKKDVARFLRLCNIGLQVP